MESRPDMASVRSSLIEIYHLIKDSFGKFRRDSEEDSEEAVMPNLPSLADNTSGDGVYHGGLSRYSSDSDIGITPGFEKNQCTYSKHLSAPKLKCQI